MRNAVAFANNDVATIAWSYGTGAAFATVESV
jgi:hypothetical protein